MVGETGETNARRVVVLFETAWDRRQLAASAARWSGAIEVGFSEPSDADCPANLDPVSFVASAVRGASGRIDGVMSSSDYPGVALAGAIAGELGLAGSRPERVITAAHKYYSRIVQRAAAPESVPDFALVDLRAPAVAPPLAFPCWLKPVKGSFSMFRAPDRRARGVPRVRRFARAPGVRR
jgi:hypothetical protein